MLSELEDVEAPHSEPLFLTADPVGPLLDHCDVLFGLSSLEEPLSPPSAVLSHHAPGGVDVLPWLEASDLLYMEGSQDEDDHMLLAMDWVSEKLDLSELDLDSLLDDDSSESPDSPGSEMNPCAGTSVELESTQVELESTQVELESTQVELESTQVELESTQVELESTQVELESTQVELESTLVELENVEIKSEPLSPGLSQVRTHTDSDSDSGIESSSSHTPPHTPIRDRSKPYSRPDSAPRTRPNKPAKTAERKIKKMEQNKTAATRYRQKKRVEQEELNGECLLLEKKNQELTERAQALSREIQYLKDLMEEVRRHHQNKNRTAAK